MVEGRRTVAEVAGPPEPGYNYQHFSPTVLLKDMQLSLYGGPAPGELAPDFELSTIQGERVRLSDLHGHPVVLIFGSVT